jgi:hypothetical protein
VLLSPPDLPAQLPAQLSGEQATGADILDNAELEKAGFY